MIDLPQPLTPADCNLKDFQFVPVDVDRLLKSETWVLGTGDERAAAMTLWLTSWHQVPAASLPKDDRMLAHLSQSKNWKKVKEHALRGWIEASDGRLYHPVVAEKALEAWVEKLAFSLSGAAGNAKRWGVEIDTAAIRLRALDAIRMLRGLAPQSKTLTKKAVAIIEAGSRGDSGGDNKPSGGDASDLSGGDSGGDRKGQGQGQGQGYLKPKPDTSSQASTGVGDDDSPPAERENPAELPQMARNVQISLLLRAQDVHATSQNPIVAVTWAQNPKVTDEVLNVAITKAKAAKPGEQIPVKYLARIVETLLAEQDAPPPEPKAQKPKSDDWAWKRSNQTIDAKGRELGMFARGGESYPDFAARIQAEIDRRKGANP